jgi:hypothetical protein
LLFQRYWFISVAVDYRRAIGAKTFVGGLLVQSTNLRTSTARARDLGRHGDRFIGGLPFDQVVSPNGSLIAPWFRRLVHR